MIQEADKRIVLQTGRTTMELIELGVEDAPKLFALIDKNREHLSQWGDNTARKYPDLESVLRSVAYPTNPERLRLGIWEGALMGSINLTPHTLTEASIGYWVGKEYCGRYVATLATRAIVEFAWSKKFRLLTAEVHQENRASQFVLWRNGFRIDARRNSMLDCVLDRKI